MPTFDPHARRHHPQPGETELFIANRDLASIVARGYFIPGGDDQDVLQECELGLLIACRDFDGQMEFRPYAVHVIRQWIRTRVTAARRMKHELLTHAGRVGRDEEGELQPIIDLIGSPVDTERQVFAREALNLALERVKTLTVTEREGLRAVVNGIPYADDKRIDNAIQRARRKLSEAA